MFQGTPNTPPLSKVDRRQGTIDEDSTYQKFLANLNASQSEAPNSEESSASKQAAKTPWEATLEALEKREAAASQVNKSTHLPSVARIMASVFFTANGDRAHSLPKYAS